MKNTSKGKVSTAIIVFATLVLAGVAIFTAIRLYQLRQQPVAPNVPSSEPKAEAAPSCNLSFTLTVTTPSPTASASASPSPTASASPSGSGSPTPSPTGSPGVPNACGGTCGSNFNCASNLICYQNFCRNPECTSSISCVCGSGAPAPTPTAPALPQSGTDWPTVVGAGVGIFVIIGSLLLAL